MSARRPLGLTSKDDPSSLVRLWPTESSKKELSVASAVAHYCSCIETSAYCRRNASRYICPGRCGRVYVMVGRVAYELKLCSRFYGYNVDDVAQSATSKITT